MIPDSRKTSKLAITGLIFAVAAPCLVGLWLLFENNGFKELSNLMSGPIFILPFLALPISLAGVIVAIKKDMKGIKRACTGILISSIEIVFIIISVSEFLHRMQGVNPFE